MSELTLVLIRFAYLAILWIFVLSAISVVRSDMFGARIESTPRAERRAQRQAAKNRPKPARRPRGAPTHVAITDGANDGVVERLQVALERARARGLLEPGAQRLRVPSGQLVPGSGREVEDRLRAQATVEVVVQQHLRRPQHLLTRRHPAPRHG